VCVCVCVVCVCVCVCVRTHVPTQTPTHAHLHMHTCIHMGIHMRQVTRLPWLLPLCRSTLWTPHLHACTIKHTRTHTILYCSPFFCGACILRAFYTHTHTHTHTHTQSSAALLSPHTAHSFLHSFCGACIRRAFYARTHTHTHTQAHTHTHTHTHMYNQQAARSALSNLLIVAP